MSDASRTTLPPLRLLSPRLAGTAGGPPPDRAAAPSSPTTPAPPPAMAIAALLAPRTLPSVAALALPRTAGETAASLAGAQAPPVRAAAAAAAAAAASATTPPAPLPAVRRKRLRNGSKAEAYQCPHPNCGKTSSEASNIRAHMRTHTGETPYACKCGKRFRWKSSLSYHQKAVHSTLRPHKCRFCAKSFIEARKLQLHLDWCPAARATAHQVPVPVATHAPAPGGPARQERQQELPPAAHYAAHYSPAAAAAAAAATVPATVPASGSPNGMGAYVYTHGHDQAQSDIAAAATLASMQQVATPVRHGVAPSESYVTESPP